jgi:hypothetical protein
MLTVAYLQYNPQSPVAHLGRYLIDEAIDVLESDEDNELDHPGNAHDKSYFSAEKSGTRAASALVLFKKLRARLTSEGQYSTSFEKTFADNVAKSASRHTISTPQKPFVASSGSRMSHSEVPSSTSLKRRDVLRPPPLLTPPTTSNGSGSYDDGSSIGLTIDTPGFSALLGQDVYSANDFDFGKDMMMAGAKDATPLTISSRSAGDFPARFGDDSDYFHGWGHLKSSDGGGHHSTSTTSRSARESADDSDGELKDAVLGDRPCPSGGMESRPASSFANRILGDDLWID